MEAGVFAELIRVERKIDEEVVRFKKNQDLFLRFLSELNDRVGRLEGRLEEKGGLEGESKG